MSGRNLAILFVILVILGGAVYLMNQNEDGDVAGDPDATAIPEPTPQVKMVPEATINDVQRLEVKRFEDEFEVAFTRDEQGNWFQVVPTNTVVVSGTMDTNVTRIVNMTSQSVLSADSNPLSAYGLDSPQYEIVLVTRRGENNVRHVFSIGALAPTGDRYYVSKQGDPRIHVLLSSIIESMTNLLDERPFVIPETAEPG